MDHALTRAWQKTQSLGAKCISTFDFSLPLPGRLIKLVLSQGHPSDLNRLTLLNPIYHYHYSQCRIVPCQRWGVVSNGVRSRSCGRAIGGEGSEWIFFRIWFHCKNWMKDVTCLFALKNTLIFNQDCVFKDQHVLKSLKWLTKFTLYTRLIFFLRVKTADWRTSSKEHANTSFDCISKMNVKWQDSFP